MMVDTKSGNISRRLVQPSFLLLILILSIVTTYSVSIPNSIPTQGIIKYDLPPGVLFMDDFESGDFSAWNGFSSTSGDSLEILQLNPFDGDWHAQFQTSGLESGMEEALAYYRVSPERTEIFARAYYCISAGLPLNDENDRFGILSLRDSDSGWMMANFRIQRVDGIEKFVLIITGGDVVWLTETIESVYPEMGIWYSIEFFFKVHSSEGAAIVWIDGVECLNLAGANTADLGNMDQVRFGLVSKNVQHSVTIHVDEAMVSSRYIGPRVVLEDGFESGDFRDWTGTKSTSGDSLTILQTDSYDGNYYARFQTDAITSGVKLAYCESVLSPALAEVYVRGYFLVADGLPLDNDNDRFGLIGFEVENKLTATLRINREDGVDRFNVIGLDGENAVEQSTNTIYPSEGRWYCLEFYIRVDAAEGEYRAWINGVERISISGINTASYGKGVNKVRFGLTYTANVQHKIDLHGDCAVIGTKYVGQLLETFGVIGEVEEIPALRNFYWLFENQSIKYRVLQPSEVNDFADIDTFDGLVVWTKPGASYNAAAVRKFAHTRVVISHVWDFCNVLYPSLSSSTQVATTGSITYKTDWGNFRTGDVVEMLNNTGNSNSLTAVITSQLSGFSNVSRIAEFDASKTALFQMSGEIFGSGFIVMDCHATTPETEWSGIWHLFPAIKMVRDFSTGKYARWFGNGKNWWTLTEVYNHIDEIVTQNDDIADKWIIGSSVQGRDIPAIVIGHGSRYAIIDGSMHGDEKTGTFACLRIAELLIEFSRFDPFWQSRLAEYTVIIIPVLNPDGFVYDTRDNANGVNLNRQFPPGGTTTEPEAWALRDLMSNHTPTIYINIHEGWYWYPLTLLYGNYEGDENKAITIEAMRIANDTFAELRHWGWFTEDGYNTNDGTPVWIGSVYQILKGGITSMAIAYASSQYDTSCMILETYLWSGRWDARKCLWGTDYYTTIIISFLENIAR